MFLGDAQPRGMIRQGLGIVVRSVSSNFLLFLALEVAKVTKADEV